MDNFHYHYDGTWLSLFAGLSLGGISFALEYIPVFDQFVSFATHLIQLGIAFCGAYIVVRKAMQLHKKGTDE